MLPCASLFGPKPPSLFRVLSSAVFLFIIFAVIQPVSAVNAPGRDVAPYALIYGTVWGPDNQPVYGIRVKIRRAGEKKVRWEATSDHSGEFAQRVPAGEADYLLTADVKGSSIPKKLKQLKPGPEVNVHIINDEREDIGVHLIQ
jgi:hypothetical protein